MAWPAIIAGAASIAGGLMGSNASKKAAKLQARAQLEALELQRTMYERGYRDLAPYRDVGTMSLADLGKTTGADSPLMFLREAAGAESPLYKMRMEDTMNALNRQLGARGLFFSGPAMQNILSDAARRVTAEEAENRWDRNLTLADIGRMAAGMGSQAGQVYASDASNTISGTANNLSNLAMQQGSNWQNTIGNLNQAVQGGFANKYFSQYMDRAYPEYYGPGY